MKRLIRCDNADCEGGAGGNGCRGGSGTGVTILWLRSGNWAWYVFIVIGPFVLAPGA